MMSEYGLSFDELWHEFPVCIGFALLEARRERLGHGGINYIDRAAFAAMHAKRAELEAAFDIVEPAPPSEGDNPA